MWLYNKEIKQKFIRKYIQLSCQLRPTGNEISLLLFFHNNNNKKSMTEKLPLDGEWPGVLFGRTSTFRREWVSTTWDTD